MVEAGLPSPNGATSGEKRWWVLEIKSGWQIQIGKLAGCPDCGERVYFRRSSKSFERLMTLKERH